MDYTYDPVRWWKQQEDTPPGPQETHSIIKKTKHYVLKSSTAGYYFANKG